MFESVLEVDPHFYQARLALARIDRREKRNKSAISHLESIIEASRNSPAKIGISVVLAAYAETASYPSLQKKYIKDDPEPFFELYERSNVEGFDQPLRTLIAFGRALEYNAASVIVAHNHPSGVAEPSQADRDVTDRLRKALDLVDVRVLDHLVIGDGHWESFSRRGWV